MIIIVITIVILIIITFISNIDMIVFIIIHDYSSLFSLITLHHNHLNDSREVEVGTEISVLTHPIPSHPRHAQNTGVEVGVGVGGWGRGKVAAGWWARRNTWRRK